MQGDYFAAATADLARRSIVQVGDVIEAHVIGPEGNVESHPLKVIEVTPEAPSKCRICLSRFDRYRSTEIDAVVAELPQSV